MRAIVIDQFGGPESLQLREVPPPVPAVGEVLVAVHAAGVNPVDYKTRRGYLAERLPHDFPCILGWDVAGTIAAVGDGVTTWQVGDEVFGYARTAVVGHGCYAEYTALPATSVAAKPRSQTFAEAAAVPLAGLTAWQSLFADGLDCQPGETVLVHAAAGGVGAFAVQIATAKGLRVIGTAGPANQEFVRELGAEAVVDYLAEPFEDAVRRLRPEGLQAAFDTVGGDTTPRTGALLAAGGRLVSIAKFVEPEQFPALSMVKYVFCQPDQEQLAALAEMLDGGQLRVHLAAVLPLEEVAAAHAMLESRHTRGKVVLQVR